MRLAVNIDHFATLREARLAKEPEPVLVALLAEQAGAQGIVCHLRGDRRHIKERDLHLLRKTIKTKLNLEMAATAEMLKVALEVKPDTVSLVPERPDELTTEGGLNILNRRRALALFIQKLQRAGIQVSIFIDADKPQILAAAEIGASLIEINTGPYAETKPGRPRLKVLDGIRQAADFGLESGLEEIHAGHGLDYVNVGPIGNIPSLSELSIGFSIVARAAVVGISQAVAEMAGLLAKKG
jgi:pyridoxine 5-phosphate synthase